MVYLADAAGRKNLALIFAFCACFGAIGAGNLAQANSISLVLFTEFHIPTWMSGLLLTGLVAAVILGGIKRIGSVAERLVPSMVALYLTLVIVILMINARAVPAALASIVSSAFTPVSAVGGFTGATVARAIEYGIRRGVISSESGVGSAGIAHSAAMTTSPVRQGNLSLIHI